MSTVWHAVPQPDRKELRSFGLTTGALVAALFGLAIPWLLGRSLPWWPWAICVGLVAWALLAPSSLRTVYSAWMRFGLLMSRVTTPLILGVTFFLVLAPVGIVRGILGRDSLARRFDAEQSTYRVASKKQPPISMERPF
jgi:hypothetical protein